MNKISDITRQDILDIIKDGFVEEYDEPVYDGETGEYITYTIQKGDSLYQIAKKYNIKVNDIKLINNLKTDNLSIGQKIKIPTTNEKYINYQVVKGDSLYQIAKKFNVTVNEIKSLNNLTSNILSIGQELKIPR